MARSEPMRALQIQINQESGAVVLSIDFLDDRRAEAFARCFDHHEPYRPMALRV